MLKVVIVDDEIIVRVGFQSCINWEDYGCQVIGTCESGKDAILLFQKEEPDLVFTDIMMPEMNGIELLKYIRNHHPKTKVVVLSCVNEIEYVKQAIKMGAEDYILKLSFTRETMVSLITKLKDTIMEERNREGTDELYAEIQSFNREEGFRMLLSGKQAVSDREALLDKLGYLYNPFDQYYAGCFLIDHYKAVKASRDADAYIMHYGLLNIIKEYFGKYPLRDIIFTGENEIMVLFHPENEQELPGTMEETWKLLNHALRTHLNLTVSMGMNMQPCDRLEIPVHYQQARNLAYLRFFDGSASYHEEELLFEESFVTKRHVQKGIQEAVFKQDGTEAFVLVDRWFDSMRDFRSYGQILNIRRSVVETWIFVSGYSLSENSELPEYDDLYATQNFWGAETLEELKQCFQDAVQSILDYLQANKAVNLEIQRLLQYLETHVDENISLEDAAGRCALGKSQFCILFKKSTGETFINYFNRLKLKKAYELLRNENIQVQEAANQIGIRDISYFSRLFKKHYHMSPSDVRKL